MTTSISATTPPILEIMTREDRHGDIYDMVEMLARTDELLLYADWTTCNANLTYRGARDASEPYPGETAYDEGVDATFGTSAPYEEPTTQVSDMVKIDYNKLHDRKNRGEFLDDEYRRHFSGFRKKFGDVVFYGDRTNYPKRLRGFGYRSAYSTLSSDYVYDNSGGNGSATANKASVYAIKTGPGGFQFTYPEYDDAGEGVPQTGNGSNPVITAGMGFKTFDYGMSVPLIDGNGRPYPGFQTYWQQRFGMVVHDPRAIARICNVSCTNEDNITDFSFNYLYLFKVLGRFRKYFGNLENVFIVVPSIIHTHIAMAVDQKGNVYTTIDDPFGRPISSFNFGVKVPIITSDSITEVEAKVA